jgi:hypothetical protein
MRLFTNLRRTLAPYSRALTVCGFILITFCACMAMTGCMVPGWLAEVETIGETVGAALGSILAIAGRLTSNPALTAAGAAVTVAVEAAQVASSGLNSAIQAYKSTPNETTLASLVAAIQASQSAISQIESIEGVPTAEQTAINEIIATITAELQAVESVAPLATEAAAGQPLPTGTVPNTQAVIKAKIKASVDKLPAA